jgi:hypothetical protein
MEGAIFGQEFLNELLAEAGATRKCLDRDLIRMETA